MSACGAANFEEVPGREQYGAGDDATAQWADDMLAFHEENFRNDKGVEVRSMTGACSAQVPFSKCRKRFSVLDHKVAITM